MARMSPKQLRRHRDRHDPRPSAKQIRAMISIVPEDTSDFDPKWDRLALEYDASELRLGGTALTMTPFTPRHTWRTAR